MDNFSETAAAPESDSFSSDESPFFEKRAKVVENVFDFLCIICG